MESENNGTLIDTLSLILARAAEPGGGGGGGGG